MVNLYSNFITCRDEANVSDVAGKRPVLVVLVQQLHTHLTG